MNVTQLRARESASQERWLTFKEAAEALNEDYGFHTTWRSLEKLAQAGRGMPSKVNFGKRQVRLSAILPWLREQGIIDR